MLSDMQESFSELKITRELKAGGEARNFAEIAFRNLSFLEEFYYYEVADSTNERAKEKCRKFCLFFAERQTAGRGRLGRRWFSDRGGLYFSITLPFYEAAKLTMVSALSVAEAIPGARIKWPNDVLLGDLKFSGILGEIAKDKAIVGIGINVENEIPQELKGYATNISTFYKISRAEVFERFTRNFNKNYSELVSGNWSELFQRYRKLCATVGIKVKVITPSGEFSGIADLSEDGAIVVGGQKIYAGDCIHLRV
ncbi:MAG: biotin--[acetyl-CoA-carboxylase] ligase [Archaeoglobi archaeon]|nr:biotin--[acetyl-CoA-carboxylase] ligase [Archaeoglobi archaeon]